MRTIKAGGSEVHGLDLSFDLVESLQTAVVARLPGLPMRESAYDGVYSVLTLEHIEDHESFFTEAARVTKGGGVLAIVINHPTWTAPESTPITDEDGEVLWRPGRYFEDGWSEVPAGPGTVTFHHRSMSGLLNAAADAGWRLEQSIERPHHDLHDQAGIPRLLACRWRRCS